MPLHSYNKKAHVEELERALGLREVLQAVAEVNKLVVPQVTSSRGGLLVPDINLMMDHLVVFAEIWSSVSETPSMPSYILDHMVWSGSESKRAIYLDVERRPGGCYKPGQCRVFAVFWLS